MGLAIRLTGKLAFLFALLFCPVFGWTQEGAEPSLQAEPASQQSSVDNAKVKAIEAAKEILFASERIVFLGDSNTHAAEFIVQLEAAILELSLIHI